jgi:DNA-binding ferritin-like protein
LLPFDLAKAEVLESFMAANEPGKQAGGNTAGLSDVATLRRRAREHIEEGAVTPSYPADRKKIVQLLNEALATELVCVLRYKRHYFVTKGIKAKVAAAEFLEHAQQEQAHADQIAQRIVQLGEEPDMNPSTLTARSHAETSARATRRRAASSKASSRRRKSTPKTSRIFSSTAARNRDFPS